MTKPTAPGRAVQLPSGAQFSPSAIKAAMLRAGRPIMSTGVTMPAQPQAAVMPKTNDVRFTDPKLNAMREAALAGDWKKLFTIAPRGCTSRDGVTRAHGVKKVNGHPACGDTDAIVPGDPRGAAMYHYWHGKNPYRKNLTIQDLRVYLDQSGRVQTKKLTPDEIRDFFENYQWGRHDWTCTDGQIEGYIGPALSGRLIYPLAQCAESSSSRRKKVIKKVAVAALAVTGAVFLGPAIVSAAGKGLTAATTLAKGAVTGVAGKLITGGSKAAAAGAATNAVSTAARVGGGLSTALRNIAPVAQNVINSAATIKALKDGKMPPPPISLGDGSLTNYASVVGEQLMQKELERKLTDMERQQMQQMVDAERRALASYSPPHLPVVNSALPPPMQEAQKANADSFLERNRLLVAAGVVGVPLLFFALKR